MCDICVVCACAFGYTNMDTCMPQHEFDNQRAAFKQGVFVVVGFSAYVRLVSLQASRDSSLSTSLL